MTSKPFASTKLWGLWYRSPDYIEQVRKEDRLEAAERWNSNYRQARRAISEIGKIIDLNEKLFWTSDGQLEFLATNPIGVEIQNLLIAFWTETAIPRVDTTIPPVVG